MTFFHIHKDATKTRELSYSLLYPHTPVLIDYRKLKSSYCKKKSGLTEEGELKDEQIELEVVGLMLDQGTAQTKPDF